MAHPVYKSEPQGLLCISVNDPSVTDDIAVVEFVKPLNNARHEWEVWQKGLMQHALLSQTDLRLEKVNAAIYRRVAPA
jgi:hypothetical protein